VTLTLRKDLGKRGYRTEEQTFDTAGRGTRQPKSKTWDHHKPKTTGEEKNISRGLTRRIHGREDRPKKKKGGGEGRSRIGNRLTQLTRTRNWALLPSLDASASWDAGRGEKGVSAQKGGGEMAEMAGEK